MLAYQLDRKPVRIMGSLHLLPEAYKRGLQTLFGSLLDESVRLILECDFDIQPDLRCSQLPAGALLRASIDPRLYRRLVEQGRRFGLAEAEVAHAKPWWAGLQFSCQHAGAHGYREHFGVDRIALDSAKSMGAEVYPLESREEGLLFFDRAPRAEQVKFARFSIDKQEDSIAELRSLTRGWEMGEVGLLEEILRFRLSETPKLFGGLINERNRLWLDKIKECIQDGKPTLIVVGALHLVGQDGLIQALTRLAYVLKPIFSEVKLMIAGDESAHNTGLKAHV